MNKKTITCVVLAAILTGCQTTSKQEVAQASVNDNDIVNNANNFQFDLIDRCLYGWTSSLASNKQSEESVLSLTEELAAAKQKLNYLQQENAALKQHINEDRQKREKAFAAFRQDWCSVDDEGEKCTIE